MKITIAAIVAGPAWGTEIALTQGLALSPEGFTYNGTNVVEVVQPVHAASQLPIDRGNQASTFSFKFTNDNASTTASEQNLILYFATLPRFGLITFYAEQALSTPFAYMVGGITALNHTQIGLATIRNFTISGGPITTTLPTPPAVF